MPNGNDDDNNNNDSSSSSRSSSSNNNNSNSNNSFVLGEVMNSHWEYNIVVFFFSDRTHITFVIV